MGQDPVAAADFFQLMLTLLFEHLFGWDYKNRQSTKRGGILGQLHAFYGTSELTERGGFHGHFLLWLLGGLNPSDIHEKLKIDDSFKERLFAYYEDIIHHHLPDVDIVMDTHYEPRVECPPNLPEDCPNLNTIQLAEWKIFMDSEIKKLGEIFQRHKCRQVCHKYGNEKECRFQFPHDLEKESYFDTKTNSVVLKCLDPTINFFNRFILVFCRHNHDIKSILSGKAAKAAMFYITDYITKMDLKTYEVLTLLSRAVAAMPSNLGEPNCDRAKTLLHKCIAQFTRQQQIHAQQAARYLRGFDDSIKSHETVPMMSNLLMDFVTKEMWHTNCSNTDCIDSPEAMDFEPAALGIQTDHHGKLLMGNQFLEYLYRSDLVKDFNFYEFCRLFRLEKIKHPTSKVDHGCPVDIQTHLSKYTRYPLKTGHPLHMTHQLVQHTNESIGHNYSKLVPRVIGTSIPRSNSGTRWMLFTLAHFKPFDIDHPLLLVSSAALIELSFKNHSFSPRSLYVMKQWDAIHECQDERDAERLRKRTMLTTPGLTRSEQLSNVISFGTDDEILIPKKQALYSDFKLKQELELFEQSHWLLPNESIAHSNISSSPPIHTGNAPSTKTVAEWNTLITAQENAIMQRRRNPQSLTTKMDNGCRNTVETSCSYREPNCMSLAIPWIIPTSVPNINLGYSFTAQELIDKTAKEFGFNKKQMMAFNIIAHAYLKRHVLKHNIDDAPLRMLLTGPGGTGKTWVVKGVHHIMCLYNCDHKIHFLAPTGSAAALIEGMTVHKGLGIKVKSSTKGKGN